MPRPVLRSLFLGFVKIHVLFHAAAGEIYGLQMMEELSHHGFHLGPGTLYPILHELERDGSLRSVERVVEGKVRKYYIITEIGRETLSAATRQALELIREIAPETGEKT